MSLGVAGVLADARTLWRSERALLVPLAGMFFLVPMLGLVLLIAGIALPEQGAEEELRAAMMAFYQANLVAILCANIAIDFGTFAVLNLFLQGAGRTLGEVLLLSLRRFLPFLILDLITGMLFGVGMSLFVLPGLFAFARTWLAAPALAAAPERGLGSALRQGWERSAGFAWIGLLGAAAAILLLALLAVTMVTVLLGTLSAVLGDEKVLPAAAYVATATIAAGAWTMLALARVAAYRRTGPSVGT